MTGRTSLRLHDVIWPITWRQPLLTNARVSQRGVLFCVPRRGCNLGFKAKRVVRACVGLGGCGQGAVHCLVSQGSKGSVVEQRIEIGAVSRVNETISPVLLSAFASRCPCLRGARIAWDCVRWKTQRSPGPLSLRCRGLTRHRLLEPSSSRVPCRDLVFASGKVRPKKMQAPRRVLQIYS